MFEEDDDLVPVPYKRLYPLTTMYSSAQTHPLAVAAEKEPLAVVDVAYAYVTTQRVESRLRALSDISGHNRDIACMWLANRHSGERSIDICSVGSTGRGGFFSGHETEVTAWRTKIRIGG